jgi:hypothetical protein
MVRMSDAERHATTDHGLHIPPTNEEREQLMDSDYWDWEIPVEVVKADNPGLRLTLRFDGDEVRAIVAAARHAQMPTYEYIKRVILEAANTETIPSGMRK